MNDPRLALAAWDALPASDQETLARDVASRAGGRLLGLAEHAQGAQRHRIATIGIDDVTLALIPGGPARLGWDPESPLALTEAQLASWKAGDGGARPFSKTIAPYLAPARAVELEPFLLEVKPRKVGGWLADLEGDDLLAAVAARVATEGFRIPTDDEWEHALRAGCATIFRWGDEWPDGIPFGKKTTFDGHKKPNAFGLSILGDQYQAEVVDAPLAIRGGDGGSAVCGGRPNPEAWYTFACAFRHPRELWEDVVYETLESGWVRRARSIP